MAYQANQLFSWFAALSLVSLLVGCTSILSLETNQVKLNDSTAIKDVAKKSISSDDAIELLLDEISHLKLELLPESSQQTKKQQQQHQQRILNKLSERGLTSAASQVTGSKFAPNNNERQQARADESGELERLSICHKSASNFHILAYKVLCGSRDSELQKPIENSTQTSVFQASDTNDLDWPFVALNRRRHLKEP